MKTFARSENWCRAPLFADELPFDWIFHLPFLRNALRVRQKHSPLFAGSFKNIFCGRSKKRRSGLQRRRQQQPLNSAAVTLEKLETRQLLAATPIAGLSDEFDNAESTSDCQRVNEVEGWNADQLNVYDIDSTQAGRMVQQPNSAVWYQNWRGPMSFKNVTGEFSFTTEIHVTDRDDIGSSDADDVPGDGQFSLAGAMIRTPRKIADPAADWNLGSMQDDGTNNGENYVFLSAGYGNADNEFSLEVKTTRNSDSQLELTPLGQDVNTVTVQISRVGTSIITMYQLPGSDWQVHRRYARPDMPETMQVGLVSYSDWTKANDFDPFTHNSTVLIPGGVAGDPTPSESFNPDITAAFEYARYATPDVPPAFAGANLTDPNAVSATSYAGLETGNLGWVNETSTTDDIIDYVLETSVPWSLQTQAAHVELAEQYSESLGRAIPFVTYEGGSHLSAFGTANEELVHSAQDNPRFDEIYATLLNGMEQFDVDMHIQYVLSSQGEARPGGEFGVLHEMDVPLEDAHEYRALVDYINGDLAAPLTTASIEVTDDTAHELGDGGEFTVTRSGLAFEELIVSYSITGTASNGTDYEMLSGEVSIAAGENTATISVTPILDSMNANDEGNETVTLTLVDGEDYMASTDTFSALVTIVDNAFPVIADQTMRRSTDTLEIELPSAVNGESIVYMIGID